MDKKQFIKDYERKVNFGKARAYSKISLERPLSDIELKEYKEIADAGFI